jgi:hypothetical protein
MRRGKIITRPNTRRGTCRISSTWGFQIVSGVRMNNGSASRHAT